MTDDLMKTKEVMAMLQISRSTLYRLIDEGRIIPVKLGPKTVRYRKEDVEKLIEQSKEEGGK